VQPNPFLGVFFHAIGGLAAASFYIPFKRVRNWSWESYWLIGGIFSWIVVPWVIGVVTVPDLLIVLRDAPRSSMLWSFVFGLLWGVGGLTFGLSMRYLGMSLGYALALGCCAAFGTIIPPIFRSEIVAIAQQLSGRVTLAGVAVCLAGIAVCALAGLRKERELSAEAKTATIQEFNFVKGVAVALFAGVMSACMAFAIAAGKPIAELAVAHHVRGVWQNNAVFIIIFAGGMTTNAAWCLYKNARNRSFGDYVNVAGSPLLANVVFAALAGTTWYFQFFFYGMGTTQMGEYDFSSWTLHMAFIIVFSNLWGLWFREWRGTSVRTHVVILAGIAVLIVSTVVVGVGTRLKERESTALASSVAAAAASEPGVGGGESLRFR
jgi:L-rhamnose-H+ transport protein